MLTISTLFMHYLQIPYEKFSAKVVSAVTMMELIIREFADDEKKSVEYTGYIERTKWLIENTEEKLHTSIYKLDLYVNPEVVTSSFRMTENKIPIRPKDAEGLDRYSKTIEFSESDIVYHLFKAMSEIHQYLIIMLENYNQEFASTSSGYGQIDNLFKDVPQPYNKK